MALGASLFAQNYTPGPQVLTFWSTIDDSDQPYAIYVPTGFDASKKYPLVISLHGASSNHRLNLRRVFGQGNRLRETDAEASRYFPSLRDVDYIVVSPYARGTMGYQSIAETDVYDVIADVKRRFPVDDNRIYLTGLSMGGGGALWLGLTRPDLWAAIAAVCAASPPTTEELAANALNAPVHLFHGEQDPVVPVESSRAWQKRFLDLGVRAEYVEYPGVRHNSWDYAYKNGAIFDWFTQFHRVRYPDHVRFTSDAFKYAAAYWAHLDALTPGTQASIDARFTGRNALEIHTRYLDAFTLNLAGHPKFSSAGPLTVAIDGASIRTRKSSFSKTPHGWAPAHFEPGPGEKHPGTEGPIREAFAARHIYVYGTSGSPSRDELNTRRHVAAYAADWTGISGRLAVTFPVKTDNDVQNSDLQSSNLVLFGTKETNRMIARLAAHFPVELNAGAADYGLVFVVPLGKHYALVNSGLPWWTGADQVPLPKYSFLSPPWAVLQTFGDFILFKESLEDVVVQGRFDRHWKLPPDAAAKMNATGAVVIK